MDEKEPTQSAGIVMQGLTWVCALALLTAVFSEWYEAKYNPNRSPEGSASNGINEVKLRSNPQHHYMATGAINGKDVVFLVDTGATRVAIPPRAAEHLGLARGRKGYANTANGMVDTFDTTIDTLTLGTITLRDVRASITMGMRGEEILLGMSALKEVDFSQRDGVLTLRQ